MTDHAGEGGRGASGVDNVSRPALVYAACAASLAIGLIFVFVGAPHPWGREGFDHYHEIALGVAAGGGFPTMEVPWGYAFFLAAFYRVFGDHPAVPLTVQVVLNALIPILVFEFARTRLDRTTATLAAVLTGLLSFNTVYASTQSSDAVCTCIFMAAVVAVAAALRRDDWRLFALAGALAGIAPQFRPNLILIPFILAAFAWFERRTLRRAVQAALLVACAGVMLTPWVVRNYQLTGTLLPTSVHGGVQLWYGTLQTGRYLNSQAYNPRAAFESAAFDYTSLDRVPIIVSADLKGCAPGQPDALSLTYWSDHDATPRFLVPDGRDPAHGRYMFSLPAPGQSLVLYYYFTTQWPAGSVPQQMTTPARGAAAPFTYFVSQDHLGDLDRHGDLLDVFDVVRLARDAAWNEPPAFAAELRSAGISKVQDAVTMLAGPREVSGGSSGGLAVRVEHDANEARIAFSDGSAIAIPRNWDGRVTSLTVTGTFAAALMTASRSLAALRPGAPLPDHAAQCAELENVTVNNVFYRRELHAMRRYSALALDNIRREPVRFVLAAAYRAVRLFVIFGTDDLRTAQQFSRSRLVYAAGTIASALYLALLIAGMVISWRRRDALLLPAILILSIPATLAPVLTNMRYTVTVQPLIFIFIAVALAGAARRAGPGRGVA
jgi:hypothetical protein